MFPMARLLEVLRSVVPRYLVAILLVTVPLLIIAVLAPLRETPSVLFCTAVAVAAWYGGRGPALLAALLSTLLIDYYFVEPIFSVMAGLADVVRGAGFMLVAFLVSTLYEAQHQAARELTKANAKLEARVAERTGELLQVNASLRTEIDMRERSEEQLRDALQEQQVLLREVHHRVKNNLQVVLSLLKLQARRIQDNGARQALQASQDRIRTIAIIHEGLCRATSVARIDLGEYIRKLVDQLLQCYRAGPGEIVVRVDGGGVSLGIETALPCALIVNELVSNSLKHAFPEGCGGEICVDFSRQADGKTLKLTVSDNGVNSFQGRNPLEGDSVGLQIVAALTKQLGGAIHFASSGGTTFTITFQELNDQDRS